MCTTNEDHDIWFWNIRCNRQKFLIKILKLKKTPGDIITLYICTINNNHMMYGSCDMECNRQNFFVILDHFSPFYPSNNPKNENFEKIKKDWRHYHFTQLYHKWQSYDVWFLRYEAWLTQFFVILDWFLLKHFSTTGKR